MFGTATDITGWRYSTWGPGTQNPVTLNGPWTQGLTDGLNWHDLQIAGGLVYGTQDGSFDGVNYQDSVMAVPGNWPLNQEVTATVFTQNQNSTAFCEIELWVRTTIASHYLHGIETNFRVTSDGTQYIGVVLSKGGPNDFQQYGSNITGPGMHTGDVVKVRVVGNIHTVYVAPAATPTVFGAALVTTDLTTIAGYPTNGGPGLGHWWHNNGAVGFNANDYGFTKYMAVSI